MRRTDDTDGALRLWVILSRAYRSVLEQVQRDVARHGLTVAEFGVLEALYHKGPLLLGELQRKILVSSGGITYLVDRLARRGLLSRQACPEDRRACYAVLTEEGRALIARIFPEHERCIERALGGLEPAERRATASLLKRLGEYAADVDSPAVRRRTVDDEEA